MTLRRPRPFLFGDIGEYGKTVVKVNVSGARTRPRRAFAERPGRAVAGQRFGAEGLDLRLVHPREIIPGLVVRTGVFQTEP
jgi:hypothetical protein